MKRGCNTQPINGLFHMDTSLLFAQVSGKQVFGPAPVGAADTALHRDPFTFAISIIVVNMRKDLKSPKTQ